MSCSWQETIQAFINAANDLLPQVQAAYDRLGLAAARGLSAASNTSIRVNTNTQGAKNVRGYASGTENATPGVHLVGEFGPELVLFDGGETVLNADSTRRLQNEMELMREIEVAAFMPQAMEAMAARTSPVISALQSDGQMSNAGAAEYISIPVSITVEGNATSETVEQLRGYGEEFAARVLDVIAEAEADRRSSAYH